MTRPKKIYKYQPVNQYSLRNLKNNHIFFNNPNDFNDPFDTFQEVKLKEMSKTWLKDYLLQNSKERMILERVEKGEGSIEDIEDIIIFLSNSLFQFKDKIQNNFNVDVTDNIVANLHQIINELSNLKDIQNLITKLFYESLYETFGKILESLRHDQLDKIGISCFAEENDNLLMWSHYADSHKGFCLEFDTSYDPFTKLHPVNYSKELPEISVENLFKSDEQNLEFLNLYLFSKFDDWSYEKEWRILHKESRTPFKYTSNALTAVYFGFKVNRTDFEIIASIIKSHHSKCKFYFMNKVPGLYKVIPQGITYNTFSESKTIVSHVLFEKIKNGDRDIDKLLKEVKSNIPPQQLRIIIEAIIDDIDNPIIN